MTYQPESDLNHNHHLDPAHRYACHNKPDTAVTTGKVQDGWTEDGRRNMKAHTSRWLDIGCGHSYRVTDPACTGCKWRHDEGEA